MELELQAIVRHLMWMLMFRNFLAARDVAHLAACLPGMHKASVSIPSTMYVGVLVCTCKPWRWRQRDKTFISSLAT